MNLRKKLHHFKYKFDKGHGPLILAKLQENIKSGNCRLAVQDYYYTIHNLYLKPEEILLPEAFKAVGKFVKTFNQDVNNFLTDLQPADLIYAEKFRNKKGEIIYKSKTAYKDYKQWIIHFHTAIYLGKLDDSILSFIPSESRYQKGIPVIWHSSFISNGTALWSLEKFLNYYQPVAVKRLLV